MTILTNDFICCDKSLANILNLHSAIFYHQILLNFQRIKIQYEYNKDVNNQEFLHLKGKEGLWMCYSVCDAIADVCLSEKEQIKAIKTLVDKNFILYKMHDCKRYFQIKILPKEKDYKIPPKKETIVSTDLPKAFGKVEMEWADRPNGSGQYLREKRKIKDIP